MKVAQRFSAGVKRTTMEQVPQGRQKLPFSTESNATASDAKAREARNFPGLCYFAEPIPHTKPRAARAGATRRR
jgi:hypothetical protein